LAEPPKQDGSPTSVLIVDGAVANPLSLQSRSLLVADALEAVRPLSEADHATVHSRLDGYKASIPLEDLRRGLITDGRLVVKSGRTLCWNVKDVARIEVTAGPRPDSVPDRPTH
jgi:hypothetical protein